MFLTFTPMATTDETHSIIKTFKFHSILWDNCQKRNRLLTSRVVNWLVFYDRLRRATNHMFINVLFTTTKSMHTISIQSKQSTVCPHWFQTLNGCQTFFTRLNNSFVANRSDAATYTPSRSIWATRIIIRINIHLIRFVLIGTHANEISQMQCHKTESAQVKRFLCAHNQELYKTLDKPWISMPFRLVNCVTQICQFRVDHLAQIEQNK